MESDLTRPGYTWGFQFFHKMFLLIKVIKEGEMVYKIETV